MFPLKDDIPARHFPLINIILIVINVLVFVFQLSLGDGIEAFFLKFGFIPARFVYLQNQNWFDVSRFSPVFSSLFMHGNLIHLISNMWMLWIFGDNVEDCMGRGRYLLFYILCGVTSVFAQAWSAPTAHIPLVGASGAISGVLGAYFLTYPKARVLTFIPIFILFYIIEIPAFFFLGLWFLMQFINGYYQILSVGNAIEGGVAWWAHIGGFAAGVFLVYFFRKDEWKSDYARSEKRIRRLRR